MGSHISFMAGSQASDVSTTQTSASVICSVDK